MNGVTGRASIFISQCKYAQLRASLFHATPVLERKRRNFWDARSNYSPRKFRRMQAKHSMLRNLNAYADYIFQGWSNSLDEKGTFPSGPSSWMRNQFVNGSGKRNKNNHSGKRSVQFCEDDTFEPEMIFHSFGNSQSFYWSFVNEKQSDRRKWSHQYEEESDCSSDSDYPPSGLASERLALGLNAYGPLKLVDVKNAYRACALKWHPDRHHGSFKAVAEEKFKLCGAAYRTLCDNLSANLSSRRNYD